MNIDRIKMKLCSKVTWVAAAPLIASLIAKYCGYDIESDLMTIVTLLALFGILNDPNSREEF